jgi:hypothetical protein
MLIRFLINSLPGRKSIGCGLRAEENETVLFSSPISSSFRPSSMKYNNVIQRVGLQGALGESIVRMIIYTYILLLDDTIRYENESVSGRNWTSSVACSIE